jgi:hypothetical protein
VSRSRTQVWIVSRRPVFPAAAAAGADDLDVEVGSGHSLTVDLMGEQEQWQLGASAPELY